MKCISMTYTVLIHPSSVYDNIIVNCSKCRRLNDRRTLSALLRCRVVIFNVFINLFLDQFVGVSPRLVGPYNGGGGFQVLWSNAKR